MAENYEGDAIGYPAEVALDVEETAAPNYVVTVNGLAGVPRLVDENGNDLVTDDVLGTITVPTSGAAYAVLYVSQSLTEAQKLEASNNLGIGNKKVDSADYLLFGASTAEGNSLALGGGAVAWDLSIAIGDSTTAGVEDPGGQSVALGIDAHAGIGCTALGMGSRALNGGISIGTYAGAEASETIGSSVSIGVNTNSAGRGSVAIGTDDPNDETFVATTIPNEWEDTVQIGRGTATIEGGFHFREFPVINATGGLLGTALDVSSGKFVVDPNDPDLASPTLRLSDGFLIAADGDTTGAGGLIISQSGTLTMQGHAGFSVDMSTGVASFLSVSAFTYLAGKSLQLTGATLGTVTINPPASFTSHAWTLPSSNASGVLTNNGSGTLSWSAGGATYVANAADVSFTSNTSLGDVLTIPVAANSKYDIEVFLSILSTSSPTSPTFCGGYQVAMTFPASPSQLDVMSHEVTYSNQGFISTPLSLLQYEDTIGSDVPFAAGTGVGASTWWGTITMKIALANGSNAGNLVIRGAQLDSHATATKFRKSSWASYRLIS